MAISPGRTMARRKRSEHYVNNKEFLAALIAYKKDVAEAEELGKDKPRITLAFDVVPKRFISFKEYWAPNHWCPIA